jgi:hypothetical protein
MLVGNIISVADAQRVNQYVLNTATPTGFDYYTSDVNNDNKITISDVYGVFGRVSGRFTSWPNSVKDIKFFTQSQYTTINGSSTNYTSTIGGVTNFTFPIIGGQPDSVTYYVLIPGDANNTGYHMARLTPIEIVNPGSGPKNIIDVTTSYDNVDKSIELNYPSISVNELNLVDIPVKVKSNEFEIGSLQLAMKYNQNLLEFKGLNNNSKVGNWITFLNPNDGVIQWGGYDPTNNNNSLKNDEVVFTLQFVAKKIQTEWDASPLYITEKYTGNLQAEDLNITPSNSIVKLYKLSNSILSQTENFRVFPNPTDDYITVAFKVNTPGNFWLSIYDLNGKECKVILNNQLSQGKYEYFTSLGNLSSGEYIAVLKNKKELFSEKIIKQ